MSFPLFLVGIFENGPNEQKYGQAVGVLRCGVETHIVAKAHAKAWHATPRRGRMETLAILEFAEAKPLFTTWKNCCV